MERRVLLSASALSGEHALLDVANGSIPSVIFDGAYGGDWAGMSATNVGDVNGDGYTDIMIDAGGAGTQKTTKGNAYLFYGSEAGLPSHIDLEDVINGVVPGVIFTGHRSDLAGYSLAAAGDVNGDGYDDILISGYGQGTYSYVGNTFLIYGRAQAYSGSYSLSDIGTEELPGFRIYPRDHTETLLSRTVSVGDINGDGLSDLILGLQIKYINHSLSSSWAGQTIVVYGATQGLTGSIVLEDIISGDLAGAIFTGINSDDRLGGNVSIAGDVNNDGYDDLLIDSSEDTSQSDTYLIYGSADLQGEYNLSEVAAGTLAGSIFTGFFDYGQMGGTVSAAGDVDGDGYDDFLIGKPGSPHGLSTQAGLVVLVYGSDVNLPTTISINDMGSNQIRMTRFLGEVASDRIGMAVANAGDINGDGLDDILIGAPLATKPTYKGKAYLIYGQQGGFGSAMDLAKITQGSVPGAVFVGQASEDFAGQLIATAGDFNHDGVDDLLIGAPYSNAVGPDNGRAYLIYGQSQSWISGNVWYDTHPNDLHEVMEYGVGQVTVILLDSQGNELDRTATDDDGNYTFMNLPEGDYQLSFVAPDGLRFVTQDQDVADLTDSDIDPQTGYSSIIHIQAGQVNPKIDVGLVSDSPLALEGAITIAQLQSLYGAAIFGGISPWDNTGYAMSSAGDVNGDGFDDFLISSLRASPNEYSSGQVYLIYGQQTNRYGYYGLGGIASGAIVGAVFNGMGYQDYAGSAVAGGGDIDGDGYDDILITSSWADPNGDRSGQVYVIYGSQDALVGEFELADILTGELEGAAFNGIDQSDAAGSSLSVAGDLNGDGFNDLVIGASGASNYGMYRETYLLYGSEQRFSGQIELADIASGLVDGAVIAGTGRNITSAGDVNGDGRMDLLISDYLAGSIQTILLYGSTTKLQGLTSINTLSDAGWDLAFFDGTQSSEYAGVSIASAGDVNGDGCDDILIGASGANPNGSSSGRAYLVYGAEQGLTGTFLLRETNTANLRITVFNGVEATGRLGTTVDGAGDINGDGYDDLLIGSYPYIQDDPTDSVFVIYGSQAGPQGTIEMSSVIDQAYLGAAILTEFESSGRVSSAGDVNQDGYDDWLMSFTTDGDNRQGLTYLVYGQPSQWIHGNVWNDLNADGIQTSNETGAEAVTVTLLDQQDQVVDTTTTDATGNYLFSNIVPGQYTLSMMLPDGKVFSPANVSDDVRDSDVDAQTGRVAVTVQEQSVTVVDAGIHVNQSLPLTGEINLSGWFDGTLDAAVLQATLNFKTLHIDEHAIGDVNGDGYDDLLLNIDTVNNGLYDATALIYGSEDGLQGAFTINDILDGTIDGAVFTGLDDSYGTVRYATIAGDLNGDGFDDLAFGLPYADPDGTSSGQVVVVYGSADQISGQLSMTDFIDGTQSALVLNGMGENAKVGNAVVAAGDVNGDGVDDLMIQAFGTDESNSQTTLAYIVYGTDETLLGTVSLGDIATGQLDGAQLDTPTGSMAAGGDLNGDGYADLLFSNPEHDDQYSNVGAVTILYGASNITGRLSLTETAGQTLHTALIMGTAGGTYAGRSVASAGDVDGDGYDDLLIGAPGIHVNENDEGHTYLIYGSEQMLWGEYELQDIVNTWTRNAVFTGFTEWDNTGYSVSGAGDVNGDGFADLIIGSYQTYLNSEDMDQSFLIYGSAHSLSGALSLQDLIDGDLAGAVFYQDASGQHAGRAVSGMGDFNGDGYADLLIESSAKYPGSIYLIHGHPNQQITGRIWYDLNADGLYSENEFQAPNVIVNLLDENDQVIDSTVTDAMGRYQFDVDIDQPYRIEVLSGDLFDFSPRDQGEKPYQNSDVDTSDGRSDLMDWSVDPTVNTVDAGLVAKTTQALIGDVSLSDLLGGLYQGSAIGFADVLSDLLIVGDVNGDGFDDMLGSFAASNSYAGQVVLIYGNQQTYLGQFDINNSDLAYAVFYSDQSYDWFGSEVSSAGDVDGDGYADFFMTAYADDKSYLVYGSAQDFTGLIDVAAIQDGEIRGVVFDAPGIRSISTAGDVNGDGYLDLILGRPYDDDVIDDGGSVYLVYGSQNGLQGHFDVNAIIDGSLPGAVFNCDQRDEYLGYKVTSAGDFNGDGFDDLLVMAAYRPYGYGDWQDEFYLIYGASEGLEGAFDVSLTGTEALPGIAWYETHFGSYAISTISAAGDVDGDGYDDILIGLPDSSAQHRQTQIDFSIYEDASYFIHGDTSVTVVYENGDTLVLPVNDWQTTDSGLTYLIYGSPDQIDGGYLHAVEQTDARYAVFKGTQDNNYSGWDVSGIGDFNGDGYDDFVIGANASFNNSNQHAYVIYGTPHDLEGELELIDWITGSRAGFAFDTSNMHVAGRGDVNGDGFDDLFIGSSLAVEGLPGVSRAYLIYGQTFNWQNGSVWDDRNADGIWDDGELPLSDITVNLLDENGQTVQTTTTDAFGQYLLSDLQPAQYVVQFIVSDEYGFSEQSLSVGQDIVTHVVSSDGKTDSFTASNTSTLSPRHAGIYQKASIDGTAWLDLNGDGVRDPDETLLTGIALNLLDANDVVISQTTTDALGQYLFENIVPGSYRVQPDLPDGYTFSYPAGDVDNQINSSSSSIELVGIVSGDVQSAMDFAVLPAFTVTDHYLFYDNSYFDSFVAGYGGADQNADDHSLDALLPGQTASFGNYSNVQSGITGIVIEGENLIVPGMDESDFIFKIGNDSEPSGWSTAPDPVEIHYLVSDDSEIDRIILVWQEQAIVDTWLQITLKQDGQLNVAQDHTFYFGNAIGDVDGDGTVDLTDIFKIWQNRRPAGANQQPQVNDIYDINRDGFVTIQDIFIAWNHRKGNGLPGHLKMIQPPAFESVSMLSHDAGAEAENRLAQSLAYVIQRPYALNLVSLDTTHYKLTDAQIESYVESDIV